jgi:type II restriction enzyme
LQTIYAGVGGEYYFGENAWKYIKKETDIDLLEILTKIAENKKTSKI